MQGDMEETNTDIVKTAEYARQGEFHRNLNPNWSYYPIYLNKIEVVDDFVRQYCTLSSKILDVGCGEGVLVEKYASEGFNIIGIDKNYASKYVKQGSITEIGFENNHFDAVLVLDVLEHLVYPDQNTALEEIRRILKPDGIAIFSCPNLAHFTARLKFLFKGRLLRTANISHHPGDRPVMEYKELFKQYGFDTLKAQGIFPTIPPLYRLVMRYPSKCPQLLKQFRNIPFPLDWHFQTVFACRLKKDH